MSSAASAPDVLALIAPNGLGHLRRQVGILSRLLERVASIRVHVLCADAQMARIRDWERAARFFGDPRVTRTGRVLDPGVTWSTDTAYYKNGSLVEWLDRLSRVPDLERARLVVSDNLAGVLAFRSDAILAGSFLWGDVLMGAHAGSEQVRDFAAAEDELLARHRPPMLCVKDVAMPAVVGATRAVRLEWMCDDAGASPKPRAAAGMPRIGLLGSAADMLFAGAARALAGTGKYQLALAAPGCGGVSGDFLFRHGPDDYRALSVAVCRPGMGTVTDCVAHAVPMVTLHEGPTNPELDHVGTRLQALGIALHLGADPDMRSVLAAVDHVCQEKVSSEMRQRLSALPRKGLSQAVDFLVDRLEGARS